MKTFFLDLPIGPGIEIVFNMYLARIPNLIAIEHVLEVPPGACAHVPVNELLVPSKLAINALSEKGPTNGVVIELLLLTLHL